MEKIDSKRETIEKQEIIKNYFFPISEEKVNILLEEVSNSTQIDFTKIPVEIVGPGDLLFDFQEALTKLTKHCGSWENCKNFLKERGLPHPIPLNLKNVEFLRKIAKEVGINLDGSFEGFVYNIEGSQIMYCAIPFSKVLEMAKKYAEKEKDQVEFLSEKEACQYLKYLAEKYFFHEIGHTFYILFLPPNLKMRWKNFVLTNKELVQQIIEIQKDKYPTFDLDLIANEAFAEIFSVVVKPGAKSRIGDFPEAQKLIEEMIQNLKQETKIK